MKCCSVKQMAGLPFVYLPAVTNSDNQYNQFFIFYANDDPVIANAVSPELAKLGSLEGFPETSWIVKSGKPVSEKDEEFAGMLGVEFVQLTLSRPGKLNVPGHTGP